MKNFLKTYGFVILIVAGIFTIFAAAVWADKVQTEQLFNQSIQEQLAPFRMGMWERAQFMATHPDLTPEDTALMDRMMIERANAGLPDIFDLTKYWQETFGTPPTHRTVKIQVLDWPLVWTGSMQTPIVYSLWYLEYFGTPQSGKLLLWWTEYNTMSAEGYGTCVRFHPDWEKYPLVCGLKPLEKNQ